MPKAAVWLTERGCDDRRQQDKAGVALQYQGIVHSLQPRLFLSSRTICTVRQLFDNRLNAKVLDVQQASGLVKSSTFLAPDGSFTLVMPASGLCATTMT